MSNECCRWPPPLLPHSRQNKQGQGKGECKQSAYTSKDGKDEIQCQKVDVVPTTGSQKQAGPSRICTSMITAIRDRSLQPSEELGIFKPGSATKLAGELGS